MRTVTINEPAEKRRIAREILESLPEWFGVPESTEEYIRKSGELPFFAVQEGDEIIGFLAVLRHYPQSAEVCVMGVRPEHHHSGAGRVLMEVAFAWCKREGVRYLQVKTLDESFSDEGYAKTRAFYHAMGFAPLECFTTLWGEHCPCLLMVRSIE